MNDVDSPVLFKIYYCSKLIKFTFHSTYIPNEKIPSKIEYNER